MLDVILVNYNSTDHLLRCLKSLFQEAEGMALHVLVQDNASKDDVDRVLGPFPHVRLQKNKANLGFGKAINQALQASHAPYVMLLNPDTELLPGFFEPALTYLEHNRDVGVLGPRVLNGDGSIQGSARSFPTFLTALFGRRTLISRFLPNNPVTRENILTSKGDGRTPFDVDWVSGACMIVRRSAIADAGMLDEQFFMYWEDADWCQRMRQHGWRVVYFPVPSLVHQVGVSSEKNIFRSVVEFHRSIYRLFQKHAGRSASLLGPLVYTGVIFRLLFVLCGQFIGVFFRRLAQPSPARTLLPTHSPRRIKVVRFIARLNIGGPSIHVYLLTKGLNPRDFESILVTGKISQQEGDMSYLFDALPVKPTIIRELQREISLLMDILAFLEILKILGQEDPDIVHTHTAKAGTHARIAVVLHNLFRRRHVKTVHTFHGHVFEGYFNPFKSHMFIWIERLLARATDVIVAISEIQRKDLAERFHIAPPWKIRTIPLGFDLTPFCQGGRLKEQFRKKIGIEEGPFLVGIIGRLVPIKQHNLFLEAIQRFTNENPDIQVRFLIVGDGELREALEDQSRDLGLSSVIHFCGWRRSLIDVYADLDVLVLTSLNEGTPVSIIEAMASGTPVIATDAGGVPDLLGHPVPYGAPTGTGHKKETIAEKGTVVSEGFLLCERGILCQKGDVVGLSKGLKYLLEMEAAEKEKMIERARDFVLRTFSDHRLLGDMEVLYKGVLEKDRGRR